ncbi:hypothetical protein SAMN04489765_2664 [Tsukamurella pulmonis]|uniref:Uncharacterized protein n=1 Tax=Tsukamurella pulmonis TaxID=47312 RepID=A0A1H1FE86_9ACTN|nr:hypothetical protein [Tsukamurella pulmonis]SDQ99170.1 hypothetical protein SAMN04489765_2664 [Tsukamurella pulmonis]SUP19604.1 Uncharacterised protein [Tsukamurella pulmonis]
MSLLARLRARTARPTPEPAEVDLTPDRGAQPQHEVPPHVRGPHDFGSQRRVRVSADEVMRARSGVVGALPNSLARPVGSGTPERRRTELARDRGFGDDVLFGDAP